MTGEAEPAHHRPLQRVLITADAVGGVWQYTVDLARCLVQDGVAVLVATMGALPSDEQTRQLPAGVRLETSNYALEWNLNPWQDVDAAGRWLLTLNAEFRPDLIHLNGYAHSGLPWRCPVVVVAHSCVVSWWNAVHGCDPGPDWTEYRGRVRSGLLEATAIVAPSNFMAAEVAAHYGIERNRIQTIYNFSSTPPAASRQKEQFCFAAGRVWDQAKNFSILDEIAHHISWPIYLAGGTGIGKLSSVRMLGRVSYEELFAHMARASIFVHPALYEPFGLAILEAARAGCCLVLSDTASARELWDGAAYFVDARNPAAWVEAISRLADAPEACSRAGQAALARSALYSEERFYSAYHALYHRLLETSSAQPGEAAA